MRFFITGIAGFIGSTLAERLTAHGHAIFGVDNLSTGDAANLTTVSQWRKEDIRSPAFGKDFDLEFDVIIHLAAQTSAEKSFDNPHYDLETNMQGTYNVYDFAKKHHAKLMVNMSSMSVYGDVPSQLVVAEDYTTRPASLYGITKLAAETALRLLAQNESAFPIVSFRLFNAYGPKQNLNEMKQGMVSIYLSQFLHAEQVVVKGSLDRIRDFIYIDDIISAFERVIHAFPASSGVYNLSSGKTHRVGTVIEELRRATGRDIPVVVRGQTAGDIAGFGGSHQLFANTFGWTPRYSLAEGLNAMTAYYKEAIHAS